MTLGRSVGPLAFECLPLGFPDVAGPAEQPAIRRRELGAVLLGRGAPGPFRDHMVNLALAFRD